MVNECREPDSLVVSGKPSNKMRADKRMAEEVEKRRLPKDNLVRRNNGRTQSWETLPSELNRAQTKVSARHYLRQEPVALLAHAGFSDSGCFRKICAGGAG